MGRPTEAIQDLTLLDGPRMHVVDVMCRSFSHAPRDRHPEPLVSQARLVELDAAFEPVLSGAPSGDQWFRLARTLGAEAGSAVPTVHLRPLVDQLLDELVRAVGTAFLTRYEAIAQLRCGIHADVVENAVRDLVLEPGAQSVAINALSAASEMPTVRLLDWAASMLMSDSSWVCKGASFAIQDMRTVGGLTADEWQVVVPHFLLAHGRSEGDAERGAVLTVLFKNLPLDVRRAIEPGLRGPLASVPSPRSWGADSRNQHYARVAAASFLLMSSPVIDALQPRLLSLSCSGDDAATRDGALRGLHHAQVSRGTEHIQAWFDETGPVEDPAALVVAGNAGILLPVGLVDQVVDGSPSSLRVVEALGMTQHPVLGELAADPTRDPEVRAIARWWLEHGGRVVR